MSPLLAQSGHPATEFRCPLLGVKWLSCTNSCTAFGQWYGRATTRIPVGRPLSPLPVQLTVECGLHRGGSGDRCLGRGSRMVENRRTPRGDGETQLIERKGE